MSEHSIASARASVMVYDELNKKWIPSGSSSGLSKVHIYQHSLNNTFRVVGRKLQDQEVVINCSILKGLKYNQATQTFHQWRDNRQVYGLNFSSKDDAEAFAFAMVKSVEILNGVQVGGEDMGYRTMTREDVVIVRQNAIPQPVQPLSSPQQQPPTHHRNNSAPSGPLLNPPVAPTPSAPPPPPPMPTTLISRNSDSDVSLATQLAQAHLKKFNKPPDAVSTTSTSSSSSSGSSSGVYGTLRSGKGEEKNGVSLMDEMAKTLARRRAMNNGEKEDHPVADPSPKTSSPKVQRKRTGSDASSAIVLNGDGPVTTLSSELEQLKQEILREVRKDLGRMKGEIIEAMKLEFNRR